MSSNAAYRFANILPLKTPAMLAVGDLLDFHPPFWKAPFLGVADFLPGDHFGGGPPFRDDKFVPGSAVAPVIMDASESFNDDFFGALDPSSSGVVPISILGTGALGSPPASAPPIVFFVDGMENPLPFKDDGCSGGNNNDPLALSSLLSRLLAPPSNESTVVFFANKDRYVCHGTCP